MAAVTELMRDTWLQGQTYLETCGCSDKSNERLMATGTDLLRDTWLQGEIYRETWLQGQTD